MLEVEVEPEGTRKKQRALHLNGRDVDDFFVAEAHAGFMQKSDNRHFQYHRLHNTNGEKETLPELLSHLF